MDFLEEVINRFRKDYTSYTYIVEVNHDDDPDTDMVLRYYYMHPSL